MNKQIQAYKELQSVIEKYPEEFEHDYDLKTVIDTLERLEISEKFGIPLSGTYGYYNVQGDYDNWTRVYYMDGEVRKISWSDDGRQPEGEWLYCISFPSGAYTFGSALTSTYPIETFKAFWDELKSFDPKYCDTVNHSMYFSEENSKAVYEAFWSIFNKYKGKVQDELKEQRKKELEAELAKLNGG